MRPLDAVDDYPYECRHISPDTRRWYQQKLHAFVAWCQSESLTDLEAIKPKDLLRFLDSLREGVSVQSGRPRNSYTLHGYAQALKSFFTWCGKDDLISERARKRIEDLDMPRVEVKLIQTFSKDHVRALFAACDQEHSSALAERDQAILAVLLDTGIRARELCGLTLEHTLLDPQDPHLVVFGKGRKQRAVGPLGSKTRKLLRRYITSFRFAAGGVDTFVSHGGMYSGQPITPNGLDQILYRLRDWAGIEGVRCSAHTFRHTYACNIMEQGGDIFKLSRLLGHTNVAVTHNYLRAFNQKAARDGHSVLDAM